MVTVQSSYAVFGLKQLFNLVCKLVLNVSILFEISEIADLNESINLIKWPRELFPVLNHTHQKGVSDRSDRLNPLAALFHLLARKDFLLGKFNILFNKMPEFRDLALSHAL